MHDGCHQRKTSDSEAERIFTTFIHVEFIRDQVALPTENRVSQAPLLAGVQVTLKARKDDAKSADGFFRRRYGEFKLATKGSPEDAIKANRSD